MFISVRPFGLQVALCYMQTKASQLAHVHMAAKCTGNVYGTG